MNQSSLVVTVPSENDRLAVLIAHAGTLFAWFLAPLVVFLLKRGTSRYAEYHALQALIWSALGTVVSALTCGLAIPVFLAFHLYAAWRIHRGGEYEYPIAGDVARGFLKA
jgi:uncharacterized protein